jgi:hypothetical protein
MGRIVPPIAATVACVEPDTAPNKVQATLVTIGRPPNRCPRKALTIFIILLAACPEVTILAANINMGTQTREAGLIPLSICCTSILRLRSGKKKKLVTRKVAMSTTIKGQPRKSKVNAITPINCNITPPL